MKPTTPTKSRKLPITINKAQFAKILQHTKQPHHKVAYLLGFESGLRISEVLNLKIEDFDFERKRIRINDGKGGKDRISGLPYHWHEGLNKYIPIGISKRALQRSFEINAANAGVRTEDKPVHFHTLRHGYATTLVANGAKLRRVSQLLGHYDISTTMIYVNMEPEDSLEDHNNKWHI